MHYIRLFSENMRQGQVGGVNKLKLEETSFMDGPLENKHFYEPSSSQSTFKVCSGLALLAFKKEAMIMEMSIHCMNWRVTNILDSFSNRDINMHY